MRHVVAVALVGLAGPALAHSELLRTSPAAGSAVAASPAQVRLEFSEGVEARFSGVEITGSGGQRVPTGRAEAQGNVLAAPLSGPLPAGKYRVNWRALSADGHRTQGSFTFEVRP
jgi:copper resistance protein C